MLAKFLDCSVIKAHYLQDSSNFDAGLARNRFEGTSSSLKNGNSESFTIPVPTSHGFSIYGNLDLLAAMTRRRLGTSYSLRTLED